MLDKITLFSVSELPTSPLRQLVLDFLRDKVRNLPVVTAGEPW
jgi:hypothetical protein